VTLPIRVAATGLGEICTLTELDPCPDAEDARVIQLTLVVAVQEHSGSVVIATLMLPPLAATVDEGIPSEI
jgi:hypothetical protein